VIRGLAPDAGPAEPIVVLDWFEEIRRRMAEQGAR
jgi:hypothetical protein